MRVRAGADVVSRERGLFPQPLGTRVLSHSVLTASVIYKFFHKDYL